MWLAFSWAALGEGSLHVAVWTITIVLLLVGLVGTVVPMLPGPALIFAAAVFHALAMRYLAGVADPGISWTGCLILLLMVGVSFVLEMLSSAVGARYFGSSKAGIWGAVLGGIVDDVELSGGEGGFEQLPHFECEWSGHAFPLGA